MGATGTSDAEPGSRALAELFNTVLPRMVACARDNAVPARGLMGLGLLMMIARLRAEGVTVTRAELARRLDKSQQMFAPHIDNLVELGLITMTRVAGGHGVGTQWRIELVDESLVDALRPLLATLAPDGAGEPTSPAARSTGRTRRPGTRKNRSEAPDAP